MGRRCGENRTTTALSDKSYRVQKVRMRYFFTVMGISSLYLARAPANIAGILDNADEHRRQAVHRCASARGYQSSKDQRATRLVNIADGPHPGT